MLPQSTWQKTLLGNIVGDLLWEISKPFGKQEISSKLLSDLAEKYAKEFSKKTFKGYDDKEYLIGREKANRYVGRIKRGMLALGNYFYELKDEPDKLKNIIGALLATKQIDKTIDAAIRNKLGLFQGKLDELAEAKESQLLKITQKPK